MLDVCQSIRHGFDMPAYEMDAGPMSGRSTSPGLRHEDTQAHLQQLGAHMTSLIQTSQVYAQRRNWEVGDFRSQVNGKRPAHHPDI